METIDYYLKRGSEVFTIAKVFSKAFDLVLHSKMFKKMFFFFIKVSTNLHQTFHVCI